jgi:small subunit ribosomal protein S20
MANLKSAKKRARQNIKRRLTNQARDTEVKTLTKKFFEAIAANDVEIAQELMLLAESKVARAKGKKILTRNTAARKVSRMARKVSAMQKKGA